MTLFIQTQDVLRTPCFSSLSNSESAVFASLGYPDELNDKVGDCDFWIVVPEGKFVELKFQDFQLPDRPFGAQYGFDYVMVRQTSACITREMFVVLLNLCVCLFFIVVFTEGQLPCFGWYLMVNYTFYCQGGKKLVQVGNRWAQGLGE